MNCHGILTLFIFTSPTHQESLGFTSIYVAKTIFVVEKGPEDY